MLLYLGNLLDLFFFTKAYYKYINNSTFKNVFAFSYLPSHSKLISIIIYDVLFLCGYLRQKIAGDSGQVEVRSTMTCHVTVK